MSKYIQRSLSKSNNNLFASSVVLDEIEERRQFLAHMTSLGRQRDYITIINTEISLVNSRWFAYGLKLICVMGFSFIYHYGCSV